MEALTPTEQVSEFFGDAAAPTQSPAKKRKTLEFNTFTPVKTDVKLFLVSGFAFLTNS